MVLNLTNVHSRCKPPLTIIYKFRPGFTPFLLILNGTDHFKSTGIMNSLQARWSANENSNRD